jgi:transcription-repair coupling factor (superfamily II helicase)
MEHSNLICATLGIPCGCSDSHQVESALDEIIQNFAEGAFDVLLSTTIVESGLDVPNANTIIVQSSDRLGSPSFISYAGGLIVRPGRRTVCSA